MMHYSAFLESGLRDDRGTTRRGGYSLDIASLAHLALYSDMGGHAY